MTQGEIGAATARLLFEAGAVHLSHNRPFILAAGWASPIYIDCRRLIGEPRLRRIATQLAAAAIKNLFKPGAFDAVAGAELRAFRSPPGWRTRSICHCDTSASGRSVSVTMRKWKADPWTGCAFS